MESFTQIHGFLAAVRRGLRRREALRASLYGAAGLIALALVLPLLTLVLAAAHGPVVGWIGYGCAAAIVIAGIALGMLGPLRRWRSHHRVARFVGRAHPGLASDLLSSIELGAQLDMAPEATAAKAAETPPTRSPATTQPQRGRASAELTRAFINHVARQLNGIDTGGLAARVSLRRAVWITLGAVAAGITALAVAPEALAHGWQRMLHEPAPGPFGGARMAAVPLVGDMRITLEYPPHTGRPAQVLPSTSGDFRAMLGTAVTIETRALAPVAAAELLFDADETAPPAPPTPAVAQPPAGDDGGDPAPPDSAAEVANADPERDWAGTPLAVDIGPEGRTLRVRFPAEGPATYRFWLRRPDGQREVESLTRRIEIEPDRPPSVKLFAPAEELDVTELKRIELAYLTEDDYGLAKIELVWESQGRTERKALPLPEIGRLSAQSKFFWDLAELSLKAGAPVTYYLEVTDNDTVSGPKVSRSRAFTLRVFSPREKHEQLIARQREMFEKMLHLLGARLVAPADDMQVMQGLARGTGALVVELGTLVVALQEDELADAKLQETLRSIRGRFDKMNKEESGLLAKIENRTRRRGRRAALGLRKKLGTNHKAQVEALENDILLLADWLDRQNMENLLAISDEIQGHKQRLRRLFEELERTGSDEVMAEIEREIRALEARLAELGNKRGHLPEDVLDRFVNAEALETDESPGCTEEVRALLAAGDPEAAQRKLESCMQTLDRAAEAMEQALRDLRGDTFGDQERRFGQLMDELADLSQDQKELASKASSLWESYATRADEMMRDKAAETQREVSKTLDKLRRRLAQLPESGLTPFAKEELEIVDARLDDVNQMLADGDIAEAMAMAQQARDGLDTVAEELNAARLDEQDQPWGERTADALRAVQRAQPLAAELVEQLAAQTPSPEEIMSPADQQQLDRLRRRQQALGERARRLSERARKNANNLPGHSGQTIAGGVADARQQMERAVDRMKQRDPSGTRHESQAAAETLERTLDNARGAARRRRAMGRAGLRDEPVRIPGADEYKAPERFREDILEAMKREQAPEGFGELVKRYYEDLIR